VEPLTPIHTAPLFAPLNRELVTLLRGLSTVDWQRRTVAGAWTVRDVAAHLLDGDLRKVSAIRDCHRPAADRHIASYADLVVFINELNATGVAASRRLSTRVLTDLLEIAGRWVEEIMMSLPPHAEAIHTVLWAGEERSENWMDVGREYTERWHHQAQIRDAVNAPALVERAWLFPLLDLSIRALPRAYASTSAPEGTSVTLDVSADEGLQWSVCRRNGVWQGMRGADPRAIATVRAAREVVWRIFFNAPLDRARIQITGNTRFAEPLLRARAVMV